MEYQKLINLLCNTLTQPSTFRTKNWLKKVMTSVEHIAPIAKLN